MLLFLDIDGVMVPTKGWKSPEILSDGFAAFSKMSIYVLQQLIFDDTTVILTTSHKANYSLQEWKHIFSNRNITIANLICLPANANNLSRKEEVEHWFNLNNVHENFIIIDDDKSLNDMPDFLKTHLIQTSPMIGLTLTHLETAMSMLNMQNPILVYMP